jgi:hypothetical protein
LPETGRDQHWVVWNVIEENHPQPYASEQIEPDVTLDDI